MLRNSHLQEVLISNKDFNDRGITFIHDSEHEVFVPYSEIYRKSLSLLYGLRELGVSTGEELLFQIEENQTFIEVFWACILGGIIPVPVTVGSNDETRLKVIKVWSKLNNPYLISSDKVLNDLNDFAIKHEVFRSISEQMKHRSINPDLVREKYKDKQAELLVEPDPEKIAFIQFSSGSTGDPKGVVLSHRNLLANIYAIVDRWSISYPGTTLSWIPLTHDMGLISMHLLSSLLQINQYIMPTKLFIRDPVLWMEKAHQHRISGLFCPNFGYKYFLTFYQANRDYKWDLSEIQFICNGAEPISTELCESFMREMFRYGIRDTAMKAVYGLAEGTVCVCVTPKEENYTFVSIDHRYLGVGQAVSFLERGDPNSMLYADVGYPIDNCEVKITDKDGLGLGEDTAGYIQIKGASVTSGYYNDGNATEQVLRSDGWLNTGDIGFLHEERLVVIGREKDVIYVNGQNIFSYDIERVAEEIEGIELWNVAACGVRKPEGVSDEIIIFVLYRSKDVHQFSRLAAQVARHIHKKMGIYVDNIVPVRTIPKTTSGKIRRYILADEYKIGNYDSVIQELKCLKNLNTVMPKTTLEILEKVFQDIMGERLELHQHFIDIGGDSLILTKIGDELKNTYGIEITVSDLYKYPTISQLVDFIDRGGSIKLASVELPEQFFEPSNRLSSGFEAMLDPKIYKGLQEMAKSAKVEIGNIFISLYLYLLREVSGIDQVSVYAADEENWIRSVSIDFGQIDTLNNLFELVQNKMTDPNTRLFLISEDDLDRIETPEENRILPFISTHAIHSMNRKLNQVFHIVLEIVEVDEHIELLFYCNHQNLNEPEFTILFRQYVTLVTDMISDQYIVSS